MKKLFFKHILAYTIFLTPQLYVKAQISIGVDLPPAEGALLQLKQNNNVGANSVLGLGLPRVKLTVHDDLTDILSVFPTGYKDAHVGLTLYQSGNNGNFCPGIYVWDGTLWQPIGHKGGAYPDMTMTDGDGNVYVAKWFSSNPCDETQPGAYWTLENLYSTQKNGGGAFSSGNVYLNPSVEKLNQKAPVSIPPNGLSTTLTIDFGESDATINTTNTTISYADFAKKFGLLYNSNQITEACATGWHVPTDADWETLIKSIEPSSTLASNTAGAALRGNNNYYMAFINNGSSHKWGENDPAGTILSPFNALPSGYSTFTILNGDSSAGYSSRACWWSTTANTGVLLEYNSTFLKKEVESIAPKNGYLSVRCVKD